MAVLNHYMSLFELIKLRVKTGFVCKRQLISNQNFSQNKFY